MALPAQYLVDHMVLEMAGEAGFMDRSVRGAATARMHCFATLHGGRLFSAERLPLASR